MGIDGRFNSDPARWGGQPQTVTIAAGLRSGYPMGVGAERVAGENPAPPAGGRSPNITPSDSSPKTENITGTATG